MDTLLIALIVVGILIFVMSIVVMLTSFLYYFRAKPKKELQPVIRKPASTSLTLNFFSDVVESYIRRGHVKDVNNRILHERKRLLGEVEERVESIRREDEEPIAVVIRERRER